MSASQDIEEHVDLVTVVVPVHNEEATIVSLLEEIEAVVRRSGGDVRIVVVDDGSTDATASLVRSSDSSVVRLVRLSRNFGHQAALLAGLRTAEGDAVICMDGDGQHPPEVIAALLEAWRGGADVVNTRRRDTRQTGFAKRATASLFYRAFRSLSGLELENGMADFRLLSRQALDAALQTVGSRPFLRGSAIWIGFDQEVVDYEVGDRRGGQSSYSLRAMLRLGRDGIVGFSVRPLLLISSAGLLASLAAFAIALYAIVVGLVSDDAVPGWASTIGFLAILQGLTFALLGIFGAYLGAVFAEVVDRPAYIVRDEEQAGHPPQQASDDPSGTDRDP